jgi:hypothetical protein
MESIWQNACEYLNDPVGLWEYIVSLPPAVRCDFVHNLMTSKSCQVNAQKKFREKFKHDHGFSRAWAHAKQHPEVRERKNQYMREYYQRRKMQKSQSS